jgi:hypothetical protein
MLVVPCPQSAVLFLCERARFLLRVFSKRDFPSGRPVWIREERWVLAFWKRLLYASGKCVLNLRRYETANVSIPRKKGDAIRDVRLAWL